MTITVLAPLATIQEGGALQQLAIFAKLLGADSGIHESGNAYFNILERDKAMIIDSIAGILQAGGDILNLPVFYEVADKTAQVPEGIPERSYVNDEGQTIVKTWNEYDVDGSITINGTEYVNSSCIGRVPAISEIGITYLTELPEAQGGE